MAQICVTLGCPTVAQLVAEHRRLAAEGATLCELRLDCLDEPIDVAVLVKQRAGPVIVTARRMEDGGRRTIPEDERRRMLEQAVAADAEYVDLEEDTARHLKRVGTTQRIVSVHDFAGTPDDLATLHARLAACDADVVKLATMARSTHDVRRMLDLVQDRNSQAGRVRTIGLCMGELGTPSRLLAGKVGSPFTYAAAGGEEPLAPGQLTFRAMRHLYRFEATSPATELFGVIGDPIGHSRSPHVHNAAFEALGLDMLYVPFRVPPTELPTFLADAPELGLRGLSVTIPHKEGILAVITTAEPAVRAIGAANTLVWRDGQVFGYNTDQTAAIESLKAAHSRLEPGRALVLGAGGASKAIVHGLRQEGFEVSVSGRSLERAEELARALGAIAVAWDDRHAVAADVLVNCTPLGMDPKIDDTPYDQSELRPGMTVFDTVYNPEETLLLKQAKAQGCTTVTGVEMFVRQAARQFELFTGREPPLDVMRAALRRLGD